MDEYKNQRPIRTTRLPNKPHGLPKPADSRTSVRLFFARV